MARMTRDLATVDEAHADEKASPLDAVLERVLARRYANLSRRSFLSVMTRKIITLAGVPVAAQVFPYFAPTARASTVCGLHGYLCDQGACISAGTTPANFWVQCCDVSVCPVTYRCCIYRDYCGTRPPNWGNSTCLGSPPSGSEWCGAAPGEYVCTTVNCPPTPTYSDLASCALGCGGAKCK